MSSAAETEIENPLPQEPSAPQPVGDPAEPAVESSVFPLQQKEALPSSPPSVPPPEEFAAAAPSPAFPPVKEIFNRVAVKS